MVRIWLVEGVVEIPASYDVVIVNPPFTRPTGKFGEERGFFGFVADERTRKSLPVRYRDVRERVRGT